MVVRDVTAACPPPVVQIDRSFAAEPPVCTGDLGRFRYEEDATWIGLTEQSVRELVWRGRCLNETMEWIEAERAASAPPVSKEGPTS